MNRLPFFIATRYLRGAHSSSTIATVITLAAIGIALGSSALALTISVMRGFQTATYQSMQSVHPMVTVDAFGNPIDFKQLEKQFKTMPEIIAVSPYNQSHGMITGDDTFSVILLKHIDPKKESKTTTLGKKIVASATKKLTDLKNNTIFIGQKLAEEQNVWVGDMLSITFPAEQQTRKDRLLLEKKSFKISGIFKTGIHDVDQSILYTPLQKDDEITSVGLQIRNNPYKFVQQIRKTTGLNSYTWQEQYPALVAALQLESYASFIILSLLLLLASMTIICLIFMLTKQKQGDIAILLTMGTTKKTIQTIFYSIGVGVALISSLIGLALAWLLGILLQQYQIIELPDVYYTSHLPISLEPAIFLLIFVLVMILSWGATWFALRRIDTVPVPTLLKFEA